MIVHQFQSWWKMMKKWWILIDFCTHNQIWGSDEFSSESVEFWSKFSRVFSPTHCTGCVQRVGVWPGHQVDFRNRFLDTQWCYGLVLLVPKRLGRDSEILNVNMTVNGSQIFKNSNLNKHDRGMTGASGRFSQSISRYTAMLWNSPLGPQTFGKWFRDSER